MTSDNMRLYEHFKTTPAEARKQITAGRLKGFTDINPMWRFKKLTEEFGPCGIGWKYEILNQRLEPGHGNEVAAFVDILLYFKVNGEWSEGIPGVGGSAFVAQEKNGPHTSDECFKMALTDAIGTACKALGMSADIYFEKDRTKYNGTSASDEEEEKKKAAARKQYNGDSGESKDDPVAIAAACVFTSGPYEGKTLGEVWMLDIGYIKELRSDPNTSAMLRNAINIINESTKRR